MSNYEFGGSLYRNSREMLDEIAHSWITAGGSHSQAEVRNILVTFTDSDLASECITEWLDAPEDSDCPARHSHLIIHGYDVADLERAFGRFRADIEHDMDVEARGDDEMYTP